MPEESTTPDSVELVRMHVEALDRGDLDGVMSFAAEDAVLDGRADMVEGQAAIRGFLDEWFGAYEELDFELEEITQLGGEVVFAVVTQDGRLVGTDGHIRQREGWVYLCVGGLIARLTTSEVDEARAAAERLAEERGQAMSENLDLVHSIFADWEGGDWSSADWAHPDIEFELTGLAGGQWTGVVGMAEGFGGWLGGWRDFRIAEVEAFRQLDHERVLVLHRFTARGKRSGLAIEQTGPKGASLFHIRDGKVIRLVAIVPPREQALADLGVEE